MQTETRVTGQQITGSELAHILKFYGRFGSQQDQINAYLRRRGRRLLGISNLGDATPQQIHRAREAGLIGRQPWALPVQLPQDTNVDKTAGSPSGPGPGGSPTPGRPIIDPTTGFPVGSDPAAASTGAGMVGAVPTPTPGFRNVGGPKETVASTGAGSLGPPPPGSSLAAILGREVFVTPEQMRNAPPLRRARRRVRF